MERPFSVAFFLGAFPRLLAYLPVTLVITVLTVIIGTLLGFGLARSRIYGSRVGRKFASGYVTAMRCTPPIVLLFVVYYGLPAIARTLFGADIDGWTKAVFVVVTLSLLFAAAMCEVERSAYLSVDKGQREAALAAGLSETQGFFRIVFPQALVAALPNFCNAILNTLKDGALAYTIGMIDMMGRGNLIISLNYGSYGLEVYLALALIYWILTMITERVFFAIEGRLSVGKASMAQARRKA
jgi:L-cystine transport system permease protein